MPPPRVFLIILQYNNSQDTIRCLNSVKELDYPNYKVIIVDNGSEVNPAPFLSRPLAELRKVRPNERCGVKHLEIIKNFVKNLPDNTKYEILDTKYNSGYSGGNNIGIKHALENSADYIFILNPDTTIEKGALTKLIETAESDSQIGILGPAISENGKTVYGGKIKWLQPELSHLVVELLSSLSSSTTKFYIPGAAMLIRRKVIEKIGLLDERYFLYFEDVDYCERAKQADFKLAIVPDAIIHHKPSSSTSSLGTPLLLHYHYRNAHLFNWKNGPLWVKITLPFWSFFTIIKQLIKILLGKNREISKTILTGVVDFYLQKFGQIQKMSND